jgi:glycosyltransferase involved in cell wall biosynthesis
MESLKVLHISETFVGGVYTYIKQLCNYTDTKDLQTFIVYSSNRASIDTENLQKDFSKKTTFKQISMVREIDLTKDCISLFKLIKEVRKIKPDIIHVHSSKAGVLGRIASVFYSQAKLYYTPHGYSFIREDISENKRTIFKVIEKTITRIFGGTIIACGDQEFKEANKIGAAILIRNGVYIDEVLNFKKPKVNSILTIGTSGSIYKPKNPELFNQIANKLPEYEFLWIGDGELKHILTAKNIKITGWKTREETLQNVNNLDIFLSTSLWEGLPFSIIEALTLSKPIVSSNILGNKTTIHQNKNGFLCDTIEEFVQAINFLENEKSRTQFGHESFKISNELFNLDKNFVDLVELYKS